MHTIKSLQGLPLNELYQSHKEAFKDYKFHWSEEAFYKLLQRRGFNAALSFGVFEDDKLVSFTLNGLGNFNGISSAYDMSTATIKEYRSKGYSTQIFNYSIPFLKEHGVEQYVLEVLKENAAAYSVYSKLGFKISREFNYCIKDMKDLDPDIKDLPGGVRVREIDFTYKDEMLGMCDMGFLWQNSFESLLRCRNNFKLFGAFREDKLIGYGIIEPESGDISQLAVRNTERNKGIGSAILKTLIQSNKAETIRIVNVDNEFKGVIAFLDKNGILPSGAQYEMIKRL